MATATELAPYKQPWTRPQHLHVEVFVYEDMTPSGDFTGSTRFVYIVSDIPLAEVMAARDRKPSQTHMHIRESVQCSDPQHLEGIPD